MRVRTWFSTGRGLMPVSPSVTERSTPRGKPSSTEKTVEKKTMIRVWAVAADTSFISMEVPVITLPPRPLPLPPQCRFL